MKAVHYRDNPILTCAQEAVPPHDDCLGAAVAYSGEMWNLFGTAGTSVTILPSKLIGIIQFLTIGFGFLASAYALYGLSFNMFRERAQAFRTMISIAILLIGLTSFYMWVLTIPMTMRF